MATANNQLLKKISLEFAKGNFEFSAAYLAKDMHWNIIGESTIVGRNEVLEVAKMQQLQSFPVITIINVVAEGAYVVVQSTGKATTKKGHPYNQTYCDVFRFSDEMIVEITTYLDTALSNKVSGTA